MNKRMSERFMNSVVRVQKEAKQTTAVESVEEGLENNSV